jgi:hypothetical protein
LIDEKIDQDLLSLFPQKDAIIMEGMEREGKLSMSIMEGREGKNSQQLLGEEGGYT